MARNSWGSTRCLPSKRWQASYLAPDGNRYKAPGTFPDRLEALAWLAGVRKSIDLGTWEPAPTETKTKMTVGELVSHWLELKRKQIRSSTFVAYSQIANARLLNNQRLSTIQVDKLTPADVGLWWLAVNNEYPSTPARNNRAYQQLKSCLSLAVEYGWIVANPVALRAASKRPKSKVKELPTTKDLKAILACVPHRYRLVTALTLFHGLRVGEALAVKTESIHIQGATAYVKVAGTLVRVPNSVGSMTMELHEPKTRAGNRIVPVLAEFVPVVAEHLREYSPGYGEFATMTDKGSVVFDTSYRSIFNRAKSKAGITKEITPHYGRVYLITRLAEAGATPKEIGRILGQEDVSTIVNVYMRAREPRVTELMSRIQLGDD